MKVSVLVYMYLGLVIPKTWKTKQNSGRCNRRTFIGGDTIIESEKQKVMYLIKWPWHARLYEVTRQGHDVGNTFFGFLGTDYVGNDTNIVFPNCKLPEISLQAQNS